MSAHSRRQIVRVDLAFLNPARDMHRSPSSRRAIANTARQHGAAVQSTGCTPYHILHTSNTHVVTRIHSQRRYVGVAVGTKKENGLEVRSNARRSDTWWLRDVARLTRPRGTLPGSPLRSRNIEGKIQVLGVVVACACCAPVAPPLRRELAHVFTLRT